MTVSVVIVTCNSAEHLAACLASLRGTGAEIIVVDNASADGSAALARRLGATVLANDRNRGFAAAANQGARASSSGYVLLLNPDAILLEGFGELACALDQHPEAGAAAGLLVDSAGRPQPEYGPKSLPSFAALAFEVLLINRLWPRNPVNRRWRCLDMPLNQPGEAEQPAGACLLLRRRALEQIGYLDEAFFPLWFEDVDLCVRLRAAGFRILFQPASRWQHHGAHSLSGIAFAEKQVFWYRSLLYYVRKYMGNRAALAMRSLVCVGAVVRFLAATVTPGGRYSWRACCAVLKLAIAGVPNPKPPCKV